jgi:hypothetical protein
MINHELFREIHDVISVHPEWHLQSTWEWAGAACGTSRCVAGWAIHLTTGAPVYADQISAILHSKTVALAREHGVAKESWGEDLVPATAQKLLGIDGEAAHRLFYIVPEDVARDVVQAFAEGRDDDAASILYDW